MSFEPKISTGIQQRASGHDPYDLFFFDVSDWMKDVQIDRFWRLSIFGSSTKLSQICRHVYFHVSSHLLCFILFPISFQVSKLYCRPKQYHILRGGRLSTLKRFPPNLRVWALSLLEVHPSTLFDPCRFETWATWISEWWWSRKVGSAEWVGKVGKGESSKGIWKMRILRIFGSWKWKIISHPRTIYKLVNVSRIFSLHWFQVNLNIVFVGLYSWVDVRWIFVMCFILFPSFCVVKSNWHEPYVMFRSLKNDRGGIFGIFAAQRFG